MQAQPKVSICIPTHNQAQFLPQCLEKALAQTYADYEVVVSINHCTDDTERVVQPYLSHPRLRVVRPPTFLKPGENFRYAIEQSRGKYFNYIASDDWLYPEFLGALVPALDQHPNVVFGFTASTFTDVTGKITNINRSLGGSYVRNGYRELERYINAFCATGDALLIRRSAYDAVGGIRTQIVDWELCLKLLCHGDVAYNNRILCNVRMWQDEERKTNRKVQLIAWLHEFFEECERYVCVRYPEYRQEFASARLKRALKESLNLDTYPATLRAEAVQEIDRLARDWRASAALRLVAQYRLSSPLRSLMQANTRLRFLAKHWLFARAIGA